MGIVDPVLEQALFDPKLRMFILRREQAILHLLSTPQVQSMELDPMNGYFRLLSHKVADFYQIGHSSTGDAGTVIYYKLHDQSELTLPPVHLADLSPPASLSQEPQLQDSLENTSQPHNNSHASPSPSLHGTSFSNNNFSIGPRTTTTTEAPHSGLDSSTQSLGSTTTILPSSAQSYYAPLSSASPPIRKPKILRKADGSRSASTSGQATPELSSEDVKHLNPLHEALANSKLGSLGDDSTSNSPSNTPDLAAAHGDSTDPNTSASMDEKEFSSDSDSKKDGSRGKGLSFDERVALYEAARARIFQGLDTTQQQQSAEANQGLRPPHHSPAYPTAKSRPDSRNFKFNPQQAAFVPR